MHEKVPTKKERLEKYFTNNEDREEKNKIITHIYMRQYTYIIITNILTKKGGWSGGGGPSKNKK